MHHKIAQLVLEYIKIEIKFKIIFERIIFEITLKSLNLFYHAMLYVI